MVAGALAGTLAGWLEGLGGRVGEGLGVASECGAIFISAASCSQRLISVTAAGRSKASQVSEKLMLSFGRHVLPSLKSTVKGRAHSSGYFAGSRFRISLQKCWPIAGGSAPRT